MDVQSSATEAATTFMQKAIPILGAMQIHVIETSPGSASVLLPHGPNSNHIGTIYAGSLMSAAECLGGSIGFAQGIDGFVPIVSRVEIDYLRPALSDVTASTTLSVTEQTRIRTEAERDGKATFTLNVVLNDASDTEVARAVGYYQLRRLN